MPASLVEDTLKQYERALNAGDVNAVMALYTDDAVFSPQNAVPLAGKPAIRPAYEAIIQSAEINIAFEILEVSLLGGEWAFIRSNSRGTSRVKATGETNPANSYEFFLFRKEPAEGWRIARYMFTPGG